jgi:hypothetical protein
MIGAIRSKCNRGGDVGILVDKMFDTEIINLQHNNIEKLFILLKGKNNFKLIIGT